MWKLLQKHQKLVRYIISGGSAAAIEYGAFLLFQYGLHFPVWLSQVASFLVGLVTAFLLHALWTFRQGSQLMDAKRQRFVLYVLLAAINIVVTGVLIVILQRLAVPAWIAKIIVMGAVIVWNFALLNKVIFSASMSQLLSWWRLKEVMMKNKAALLLFSLVMLLGSLVIAIVPQGAGHDEIAHVVKADAASRLDFVAQRHTFMDIEGKEQTIFIHHVSPNLVAYNSYAYSVRTKTLTDDDRKRLELLGSKSATDEPRLADAWGAAGYPGVAYLPSAVGLKIARSIGTDVKTALYIAKITTLFVNAILMTGAFLIVRRLAVRYIFFLFSCFLPVVAAASAISIDGLTIALGLIVTAVTLRGWLETKPLPAFVWYSGLVAAIILPIIKLPYLLLSLGLISEGVKRHARPVVTVAVLITIMLLPALSWNIVAKDAHSVQSQRVSCCSGPADPGAQLSHIIAQPGEYAVRMVRHALVKVDFVNETARVTQQPQRPVHKEALIVYTTLMFVSAVIVTASISKRLTLRHVVIALSIAVATIFGIITALYISANTPGAHQIWGVQARYLLPLWPLAMIACAGLLSLRQGTIFTQRTFLVIIGICMVCNLVMLLGYIG